jgi:UTP--glucose-1-phosphate uridylyltransferase
MIKKCLFPVAGYGTRFLPATKSMPKEMLPILNKPLIQYAVEEALAAGLFEVGFITGRGKRAIEDHFDLNYELEKEIEGTEKEKALKSVRDLMEACQFSYTRQKVMKGLGHAILVGETLVGQEPFGVLLADDFCLNEVGPSVIQQMVAVYQQYQCSVVAIEKVMPEQTQSYGIIEGQLIGDSLYRVSRMVEKPNPADAPSNLAVVGRYILTSDIFDILRQTPADHRGEIQITDALNQLAQKGQVVALEFEGKRFDCGSLAGFVEATQFCYEGYCKKNVQ